MSLWSVADDATEAWMRELYAARLDDQSTAAALRTASRTLLADRRSAGESVHPAYWGSFVASGDWN